MSLLSNPLSRGQGEDACMIGKDGGQGRLPMNAVPGTIPKQQQMTAFMGST